MTKYRLPDSCPKCHSRGIVFYEDRRVPGGDGYGDVVIGRLSCALCGREEVAYSQPESLNNLI